MNLQDVQEIRKENKRQNDLVVKIRAKKLTEQELVNYIYDNNIIINTDANIKRINLIVNFMVNNGVFFPNQGHLNRDIHIQKITEDVDTILVFVIDKAKTLRAYDKNYFEKTVESCEINYQTISIVNFVNLDNQNILKYYN